MKSFSLGFLGVFCVIAFLAWLFFLQWTVWVEWMPEWCYDKWETKTGMHTTLELPAVITALAVCASLLVGAAASFMVLADHITSGKKR